MFARALTVVESLPEMRRPELIARLAAARRFGYGVDTVIVTGGVSATKLSKEAYDNFSHLYHLNYIVPEHSAYATAIGAASYAVKHGA